MNEYQRLLAAKVIETVNLGITMAELGLARSVVVPHRLEEARKTYASLLPLGRVHTQIFTRSLSRTARRLNSIRRQCERQDLEATLRT